MLPFLQLLKFDPIQGIAIGIASSETPDADGEQMDYFASKPYIQRWSQSQYAASNGKSFGNIRLQHDPKKVAGILQGITFDDANRQVKVKALIVDENAKNLLASGALTGFSIGGSYVKRTPLSNGLVSYVADPAEISVVDRPCNPQARFELVQSDGRTQLRKFRCVWSQDEQNQRILSLLKSGATESLVSLVCGVTAGQIYMAKRQSRGLCKAEMQERRRKMIEFNHF